MSKSDRWDDAAQPIRIPDYAKGEDCYYGLTKREAFVMAAMQAILGKHAGPHEDRPDCERLEFVEAIARGAVMAAEATLAELDRREQGRTS